MLNYINVSFINWFHCGQYCTTTASNISDHHLCRNPGGSSGAGGLMDFFGSPQGPEVILLKIYSFCKEDQYLESWVSSKYFISAERRGSPNNSRKHWREWRAVSQKLICHQHELKSKFTCLGIVLKTLLDKSLSWIQRQSLRGYFLKGL